MTYLREYGIGAMQNEQKTLRVKVLLTNLFAEITDSTIRERLRSLQEDAYHLWDFGVRASAHLSQGDEVYIDCNGNVYSATILMKLNDAYGEIGDLVGWHRIHGAPWRNPVILSSVASLRQSVLLLRFPTQQRCLLCPGFYRLSQP